MKRRTIWIVLVCLMVTLLVLSSCGSSNSTGTTKTSSPATTTSAAGNFWAPLGTPQYGGSITLRTNRDFVSFDAFYSSGFGVKSAWEERLFTDDWTLDPTVWSYKLGYRPPEYVKGNLASSWEFTDPTTFTVHLRQGIHWQNIAPANGRELTADDIVFHFDRLYAMGGGFTKPSTVAPAATTFLQLNSVTATDKYTVVFKWKTSNPQFITETMQGLGPDQCIECPDAIKLWGDTNDWHHAIGTGPFMLTDFTSGSSATMVRNPNYWGYDERYPKNQLPYIDTLKVLEITDDATALAALRTAKIDVMSSVSFQNAQSVQKTDPQILQITLPQGQAMTVDPRNDTAPFNDIKVREAMQMAIDLPTMAQSYYGGTADPYPVPMTSNYMTGFGFPYQQWPQDLKDQYAFNVTTAKQLLASAGYPNGFKTDMVVDVAVDSNLSQIVKSYFANVGIDVDIRVMDSASWSAFVRANRKYDALAMATSGSLGFSFEPMRQISRFTSTDSNNYNMTSDPTYDALYTQALAATSTDQVKQLLTQANQYVAQQHWVISLLQPNLYELVQPWLKGYTGQIHGLQDGGPGPQLLFFYPARFWIDQSVKKSAGY